MKMLSDDFDPLQELSDLDLITQELVVAHNNLAQYNESLARQFVKIRKKVARLEAKLDEFNRLNNTK
tara:strand:- start:3602 stop:3802 length:201 start_codon:yes stop_codon:yes gene_type:complete